MFAEIAFPLPFRNYFTYLIPRDLEEFSKVGVRAAAPFGKRILTGFIINVSQKNENLSLADTGKIKPLKDIIDNSPVFTPASLRFYKWVAEYYMCSLGEALKLGVPQGSEIESKRKIIIDGDFCSRIFSEEKNKNSLKGKLLKELSERDEITLSYLQKLVKKKNIYSQLRSLEEKGALTILDEVGNPKAKAKKSRFVKLSKNISEVYQVIPEIENRSPMQVRVLLELVSKRKKPVLLSEIIKKTKSSKSSFDSLEKKGLIEIFEKEVERKYREEYKEEAAEFELSQEQMTAVERVSESITQNEFRTFLLHGITGSGKTQVYIELIKKVISNNKSALILVPEISLTPQITSRLYNNFGEEVTVIHSRMSLGERYDSWKRVLKGKSRVVIGARSALFAPLKNLGLIVVDEEHDASYKQSDTIPKYNARDASIVLGKLNNCPVLLGSATPSVESMYNALSGKYDLLKLTKRVDNAKLPEITLVDLIVERKKRRMENIFSRTLLEKINSRLVKNEGVIILQNRRGFSTQIYCNDCGELETCNNCSVPMVFHINKNIMECHYCGFAREIPGSCSHCGSLNIKHFGTGTEKVEDEIEYYFPDAVVNRIDSDSISKKFSLSKMLLEFSKGETDILVGTQMVSKGLDFSRVTLVGVISAETSLWMPDFRADERTFQLLTQVAGRAGRSGENAGSSEVVIQTQNEKHFTLRKVVQNDYDGFYQKEIADRERMGFPPFTRICLVEAKDEKEEKAFGAINDFYKELIRFKKWLKITNPTAAILSKLKGFYRFHILIKSTKASDPGGAVLRKAVLDSFKEFNKKSRFRDVKLFYDIDPQSIV
ncbi:MAG: primosomal protein N' [Ignavibacteria bacterium]